MSADAFVEQATVPAGELRERLLSFMVHEIRNPLASALWSAEMLARKSTGDPRGDRLSQLAVRSVRRLRVLLEDLFALERLPPVVPAGEVSLKPALTRALGPHDLDPEGITAELTLPADDLVVPLDPLFVDRLLHACLRRALHAGEGGSLTVSAERRGEGAVVTILRRGATLEQVEPELLSPGGSEGAGTTFTMLLARATAMRLAVPLSVEQTADGVTLRLTLPIKQG